MECNSCRSEALTPMTSTVKLRGMHFSVFARHVKEKLSADQYKQLLSNLDQSAREIFEGHIFPNEYYEVDAYGQFVQGYRSHVTPEEFTKSSQYLAEYALKGIFLMIARLLSKEFLIKRMSDMWKKVYTAGSIELIGSTDELASCRVTGVPFNEAHRLQTEVYLRTILERATGQKYTSWSRVVNATNFEFWFNLA